MGKDGDLWDDSALIKAFDDAFSKYKVMHSKGSQSHEAAEEKTISNTEEDSSAVGEENSDVERQTQENDYNVEPTKENILSDPPENGVTSSNGQDPQGEEDYNRLLSQYYEVEEQRQKILQQLYEFTGPNHQDSSYYENQISAAAQVHPLGTTTSASCPAVASCCTCPCSSFPACCVGMCESGNSCQGGISVNCQSGKLTSVGDGDLINTALGAAERALSSLKINDAVASDVNKGNDVEASEGKMGQENNSSETDLSVVLNAWYSAGFYTGK
jgi:hypothetical protein